MISVVIPVRNRPVELARALQSVIVQSIDDWEVLVIENGSDQPDEIRNVVDQFRNERIRFVDIGLVENGNIARNAGVTYSKGNVIAYLDSDDEWLPDHLEKSLHTLEVNRAMAVYGNYYLDNGLSRKATTSVSIEKDECAGDYLLGKGCKAQTSSYFVKKEAFEKIGWDNALKRGQDLDFFMMVQKEFGWSHIYEPTVVVHWDYGIKRREDVPSSYQMFLKHREDLSPFSRIRYLRTLYFMTFSSPTSISTVRAVKENIMAEESLPWSLWFLVRVQYAASIYLKARAVIAEIYFRITASLLSGKNII